jgi:hypothetical protein
MFTTPSRSGWPLWEALGDDHLALFTQGAEAGFDDVLENRASRLNGALSV